jgi:hypothetical protein
LAALLSPDDVQIMGEIVRVIEAVSPAEMHGLLLEKAKHCFNCALQANQFAAKFGFNDNWWCESDTTYVKAVIHESLLRRLPPPDLTQITEQRDSEVSA